MLSRLAKMLGPVAERAACEARFAAACAAAAAAGAPAPFRGPAADSPLGERFLDIIALVSASGFALDARPARFLCGLTFRLGARRADGSLDRGGFLGGTADMIDCALRLQAPWLEAARSAPRRSEKMRWGCDVRTTSLMRAAEASDEQRVRELLAAGAPLRCLDAGRRAALHHAAAEPDARVVAALLEADAAGDTVDAPDSDGMTPLILASSLGRAGAVRALLARGAKLDLVNWLRKSALMEASSEGYAAVAQLLADKGASLDIIDVRGRSALMEASLKGHVSVAQLLADRGAKLDLVDSYGRSALSSACYRGHAAVAQLLAARMDAAALNLVDSGGYTALDYTEKGRWRKDKAAELAPAVAAIRARGGLTAAELKVRT